MTKSISVLASSLLVSALLVASPLSAKDGLRQFDGVATPKKSSVLGLTSADSIEQQSAQQYAQLKQESASQRALAPDDYPQLQRIRAIGQKLIPFAVQFSERYVDDRHPVNRAKLWKWEVNLIASKQINAFCMPGGKIAFYTGIIDTLQMTDDEIAMVMGHEISHAILEHGRERAAKGTVAQVATVGASILSSILGFGNIGGQIASAGAQMTMLSYGRTDETEADAVGQDIAARAGYDPRASVVLWKKMGAVSKGSPPQFMSTHPSHETRIKDLEGHLQQTLPLFAKATNQDLSRLGQYKTNWKTSDTSGAR